MQPQNPKTKKPWFVPDAARLKKCAKEERELLTRIFDVVNENYQFLMATPLTQLDKKKWKAGDYAGKYLQAPYLLVGKWDGFVPESVQADDKYPIYQKLGCPMYDLNVLSASWAGNTPYRLPSKSFNCLYWFSKNPELKNRQGQELPLGYSDLPVLNVSMEEAQGRISWFQVDVLIQSLSLAEQEWPKAFESWRNEMSPDAGRILTDLEKQVLSSFTAERVYLQENHPGYGWSVKSPIPDYDKVYTRQKQRAGRSGAVSGRRTVQRAKPNKVQSRQKQPQRDK